MDFVMHCVSNGYRIAQLDSNQSTYFDAAFMPMHRHSNTYCRSSH
jgi:hypothetical protein